MKFRAWSCKKRGFGKYTTQIGVQEDQKEIALVLGMITGKVLSEDPGRIAKLKKFVEKKVRGQAAGYNLPEMLQRMKEYDTGLKVQASGILER